MKKTVIIILAIVAFAALFAVGLALTAPPTQAPSTSSTSNSGTGGGVGTAGGQSVGVTQPSMPPSLSVSSSTVSPTDTVSITTASGTPMTTRNFLDMTTTIKDLANQGYYSLSGPTNPAPIASSTSATSSETGASSAASAQATSSASFGGKQYLITYVGDSGYFIVSLLQEPIGAARKAAEADLMNQLGVSQDAMCNLNYMVAVPWSVNQVYSGMNLGFSFCPGAVVLPQ